MYTCLSYDFRMAMRWGTSNFEETEADRPEFFGQPTESPIDGSEILYFPM